eukprot:SAG31_NODE_8873_length_1369_cov_1.811811_1_plen_48_part_10
MCTSMHWSANEIAASLQYLPLDTETDDGGLQGATIPEVILFRNPRIDD